MRRVWLCRREGCGAFGATLGGAPSGRAAVFMRRSAGVSWAFVWFGVTHAPVCLWGRHRGCMGTIGRLCDVAPWLLLGCRIIVAGLSPCVQGNLAVVALAFVRSTPVSAGDRSVTEWAENMLCDSHVAWL